MAEDSVSSQTEPLFSPNLISPQTASALPEGYKIRPLQCSDYDNGFLTILESPEAAQAVDKAQFDRRFAAMKPRDMAGSHVLVVLGDDGKVVGIGTLVLEMKFLWGLSTAGHIEDIAVAKEHRRKGIGLVIVEALQDIARSADCYKTILDCSEANEEFYVKRGFERKGLYMRKARDQ